LFFVRGLAAPEPSGRPLFSGLPELEIPMSAAAPKSASPTIPCAIQLADPVAGGEQSLGTLEVPAAGAVAISLISPRPLRLWIGDLLVLDEDLWWRRYERQVRAVVTLQLPAGSHRLRAVYGSRSMWHKAIDEHCPSRNREQVRQGLLATRPDRFILTADVVPGAATAASSLRIHPAQCVRDGVVRQHVIARRLAVGDSLRPGTSDDQPQERPLSRLALRSSVAPFEAIDASNEGERQAGVQRFLVPVANRHQSLPVARGDDDAEERLEPECVVVASVRLTVEEALSRQPSDESSAPLEVPAARSVELPVHEHRGRRAPQREHRELSWPSEDELLARVPRPLMPNSDDGLRPLHDYAWRMLRRLRRTADPRSGLPNDYVTTAREGFTHQMFVWDSSFTAMCTAWAWRVFPSTATLDCLYSRQMDGGYVPRETDVREGGAISWEPDFSPNPPLQAIAEWKMAALSGDTSRLETVYPLLAAQHRWLRRNRRLEDGTYWTTGLANGLDNSPSLGDGYPDLTAQQVQVAEILGDIAELLGRADEAAAWRAERQEIAAAMNARLWSSKMEFFSTSLAGGGHHPNKVVTGFWPLWTGLVPAERVEACARHLLDPKSFWRHHPVPSLAADSPDYQPEGDYWKGSTWAPTNAATVWGFVRAGRHDLARKIVRRHLDAMREVFVDTGVIWENYCAESSVRGSISGADYSWTSLGPIALLYEVLIGVQPDALNNRIRWVLPEEPRWGLERIPLGAATIDLRVQDDMRLAVACDRPFTLEVVAGGTVRSRRIPAGRWVLAVDELAAVTK